MTRVGWDRAWPLVSDSVTDRYGVECIVGTDAVGFVFLLSCVSCVPHFLTAAVWTPPCLTAAWIPCAQDVSPRWVNIVFFLRAPGVVVSRVLVPLPSVPLWPGFQRIQDVPSCPGRLHFPCPIPVTLQGVCASPHSPLSLTPCDLGRGATSTFLFGFQGLLGKGCEQVRRPEPWNPRAGSAMGWCWPSLLLLPRVSSGTIVSP